MSTPKMPRYKACANVYALRIHAVGEDEDGHPFVEPEDGKFGRIYVTLGYVVKHDPKPGGWYLMHLDGFVGYCPDRVFRANYAELP